VKHIKMIVTIFGLRFNFIEMKRFFYKIDERCLEKYQYILERENGNPTNYTYLQNFKRHSRQLH